MKEMVPVNVRIMDSEYRISCPENEKDALMEAAQYLDTRMQDIRDSGRILGVERIAVMAALHIVYELQQCQRERDQLGQATVTRLQRQLGKLEVALSKAARRDANSSS